jgi:membrane-bound lytic murein transglycosylase D
MTRLMKHVRPALVRRTFGTLAITAVAAIAAAGLIHEVASDAIAAPAVAMAALKPSVTSILGAPKATFLTAAIAHSSIAKTASRAVLANLDHPSVESWIKRFTTDLRTSYATDFARMDKYSTMISSKLANRGMPQDLIYLAMIESGFNPQARSPVKASGLWQFMAPTAKRFGLTVSRRVDERNNPSRSTDAALTYLSHLHDKFGSWYLAAAAYNSGEGTVGKALMRVTGQTKGTDADYYRISPKLPPETRDYVPKMIAAARIGKNPGKYGFGAN